MDATERAARAVADGELVVYPTETVYGLGADALDPAAVERLFAAKGRDRGEPVSIGFPDVDAALTHTRPTEAAEAFMRAVLPGPVTVVVERRETVPDAVTAGRDRVGVRVPDHDRAREFLRAAGPTTATSANVSGTGSVRRIADLDPSIREAVAVVLDDGETPGGESTVVDPAAGELIRPGLAVDRVRERLTADSAGSGS